MTNHFELVDRSDLGPTVWDELATVSADAWLWHRWNLCEALGHWHHTSDESFALCSSGGELVAIVPLRRTWFRRARGRLRFSRLDSLGGPAVTDEASPRVRQHLLQRAVQGLRERAEVGSTVEIAVSLSPLSPRLRQAAPRVNPLLELGFEDASTASWIVDLGLGRELVWQGMKQRARRAVRKAEKAGVTVRESSTAADLDVYYGMHLETYARTGADSHPRAYFDAIWSHFVPAGEALVLFADLDGEPIAARNFGIHRDAAIYWTGASRERALQTGANHLLQWRGMEAMIERGVRWSESGEAFPGVQSGKSFGLSYFKESFGGELYPYFRGRIATGLRSYQLLEGIAQIRRAASR